FERHDGGHAREERQALGHVDAQLQVLGERERLPHVEQVDEHESTLLVAADRRDEVAESLDVRELRRAAALDDEQLILTRDRHVERHHGTVADARWFRTPRTVPGRPAWRPPTARRTRCARRKTAGPNRTSGSGPWCCRRRARPWRCRRRTGNLR